MNQVNKKMGEIEGEELEESLQDEGRVEEDGVFSSPINEVHKNNPQAKKTKPERRREENASSEEDDDDELELDLIDKA